MDESSCTIDDQQLDESYLQLPRTNHYVLRMGGLCIPRGAACLPILGFTVLGVFMVFASELYLKCKDNRWSGNLKYFVIITYYFILKTSLQDPGFIRGERMTEKQFLKKKMADVFLCLICANKMTEGVNIRHCHYCGCCVKDLDHHCGVFSNCITKKNMKYFKLSIVFGFISLGYCYVEVISSLLLCEKPQS